MLNNCVCHTAYFEFCQQFKWKYKIYQIQNVLSFSLVYYMYYKKFAMGIF